MIITIEIICVKYKLAQTNLRQWETNKIFQTYFSSFYTYFN